MVFVLTLGGFAVLGNSLKSGVISWLWETPLFVGNAAALIVRGNNSVTINNILSEILAEFDAVGRIQ